MVKLLDEKGGFISAHRNSRNRRKIKTKPKATYSVVSSFDNKQEEGVI
jgi:hypothetical protein